LTQVHTLGGYSNTGSFTTKDVESVQNLKQVVSVTPVSVVSGAVSVNEEPVKSSFVIGTTEDFPELINRTVQHGEFFSEADYGRRVAVVGRGAAEKIFGDGMPLGRAFDFRGQVFIVRGVLERFDTPPLSFNTDFNNAVMIPHAVATDISGTSTVNEILVRPAGGVTTEQASAAITAALMENRGGSSDFSVLTQAENLKIVNRVLGLLTTLVSAMAAIALLVSGIGIMNIMLVSVTERMHEIGVRKAIGATRRQILGQFITEAAILSFLGAITGVLLTLIADYFIRLFTQVQPVITWQSVVTVAGLTVLIGIIFGTFPAIKAARKDPIAALRHE
jgi:putative ABC transport system permease protein